MKKLIAVIMIYLIKIEVSNQPPYRLFSQGKPTGPVEGACCVIFLFVLYGFYYINSAGIVTNENYSSV